MLNLLLQNCTSERHLWNDTSETDTNYICNLEVLIITINILVVKIIAIHFVFLNNCHCVTDW